MSWNYRVVHRHRRGEEFYAIYEVYYDPDGEVDGITAGPVYPVGEDRQELEANIKNYVAALGKPILEYSDIVEEVSDG